MYFAPQTVNLATGLVRKTEKTKMKFTSGIYQNLTNFKTYKLSIKFLKFYRNILCCLWECSISAPRELYHLGYRPQNMPLGRQNE